MEMEHVFADPLPEETMIMNGYRYSHFEDVERWPWHDNEDGGEGWS